ncbi:MAG TPA: esterase family protein [Thermoflexia bacterium]|nr:esterase family protein [Thermoflexia bacterium]
MNVEYHQWRTERLNRDMEFKVYGHAGKPVVVFPSARGTFYQFEDFGMVNVLSEFIEAGKIQLYTVSSNDNEAWLAEDWISLPDRGWNHQQYDNYIMEEVVPFIRKHNGSGQNFIATGCSMGAYHAANFFFRHPDIFDTVIALSGLYGPHHFVGDYVDEHVYFNFPLLYLSQLTAPWYLERYRASEIIICSGQGAWEEDGLVEMRALEGILQELQVPAWFDYWGYDVNHDWPWWRKQLPYFVKRIMERMKNEE